MERKDLRPRLAAGITARDLGDEYIFLDAAGDKLHILNGSAREILLLCDGRRTVGAVAQAMAERFRIDLDRALADAQATVDKLIELGLLAAD